MLVPHLMHIHSYSWLFKCILVWSFYSWIWMPSEWMILLGGIHDLLLIAKTDAWSIGQDKKQMFNSLKAQEFWSLQFTQWFELSPHVHWYILMVDHTKINPVCDYFVSSVNQSCIKPLKKQLEKHLETTFYYIS